MTDGSWTPGAADPRRPEAPFPAEARPKKRTSVLAVLAVILLVVSIGANAVLLLMVVGLAAALGGSLAGGGVDDTFVERVIERGPSSKTIAVVRIEGLIYGPLVSQVRAKLNRAARDDDVKAVILRINSPGGYLTASDVLYHEITSFAQETGKPVVAAMDSVAASGGYYAACAADDIVAQRTTVTGSIGIIAQYFFLGELLEDKLGVRTVTLKLGDQKDWPNMFSADITPEQSEYIMTTLLQPGYDQFVDVVAEAREMDRDEVLRLATGRIYMAREAKECGLIDEIGYFERAIEIAKERAGIERARVVELVQPFGFLELFRVSAKAKTLLDLGPGSLPSLASPRIMYLWTGL